MDDNLTEKLPEPTDGIKTVWLNESTDPVAREQMAAVLKSSDIQFRNLRRIVRDLFNTSIEKDYKDKQQSDYELGYRAALRDLYKLIPTTRSE